MIDSPPTHVPAVCAAILRDSEAVRFGMPSDGQTGALLRTLAASKPHGAFLEIGTGTGLGAAWLLDGMDAMSTLVSIEANPAFQDVARTHLGKDPRLELVTGDALHFVETHKSDAFDLIFADAMPGKFVGFEHSLRLLRAGGMLVMDDLLPQPNWPENHQRSVDSLLKSIDELPSDAFAVVKLCWYTGHVLLTKRRC